MRPLHPARTSLALLLLLLMVALGVPGCDGIVGSSPCPRFASPNDLGICLCNPGYRPCETGCCEASASGPADAGTTDPPLDRDASSPNIPLDADEEIDASDDDGSFDEDAPDVQIEDMDEAPDVDDADAETDGSGDDAEDGATRNDADDAEDTNVGDASDTVTIVCGDGVCSEGEDFLSCADDCPDSCGNGVCGPDEDFLSCADDCPDSCGNGVCGPDEDFLSCADDCPDSCGNGVCGPDEDALSCPVDCPDSCGNGLCGAAETFATCPFDCPDFCGNGTCGPTENFGVCPGDCPDFCGNGICGPSEDFDTCPGDCPDFCGNGICGPAESLATCPGDCPDFCGNGLCGPAETWESCAADCPDPCGDVSEAGRCTGLTSLEFCATPSGPLAVRQVAEIDCELGSTCSLVDGTATCVAPTGCLVGSARCVSATQRAVCQADGSEILSTCATSCLDTALGATCRTTLDVVEYSGQFIFESKSANDTRTGWTDPFWALGNGFLIVSFVGDTIIDAQVSGASEGVGEFTVLVPRNPTANDIIAVYAARYDTASRLRMALANPGFTGADRDVFRVFNTRPAPRTWAWGFRTSTWVNEEYLSLGLPESGAAAQFALANEVFRVLLSVWEGGARMPEALAIWWNHDLSWSCGACYTTVRSSLGSQPVTHHIWMDGSTRDEGQWGTPTLFHEMGHFLMEAWGRSPGEGGVHYIGIPVFPGMAYSEGFATYFSSWFRGDPLYYAKQGGGFFRLNIDTRRYFLGFSVPWQRPQAANGLMQLVDENEVSAMLWDLHARDNLAIPILQGLIDTATRPFSRGYTRHVWSDPLNPATSATNTGQPSIMVGDLFDAMHCRALLGPTIEARTDSARRLPWFSASTRCN